MRKNLRLWDLTPPNQTWHDFPHNLPSSFLPSFFPSRTFYSQNSSALNHPVQMSYQFSNWDPKTLGDLSHQPLYTMDLSALHPTTLPSHKMNSFCTREKPGKAWQKKARVTTEALLIHRIRTAQEDARKQKNKVCETHSHVTTPLPSNNPLKHFRSNSAAPFNSGD